MSELSKLTHPERVFLAGAIRTTILGDGAIEESELEDFETSEGVFTRLNAIWK